MRLTSAGRGLPRPADLLALASQRFDHASSRLGAGLERNVAVHRVALVQVAGRLSPGLLDRPRRLRAERLAEVSSRMATALGRNVSVHASELSRVTSRLRAETFERPLQLRSERLSGVSARLTPAFGRITIRAAERLESLDKLRLSLNPDGPLKRGFARVHRADGSLARSGAALDSGEGVSLVFADATRQATVDGTPASPEAKRPKGVKPPPPGQGDLF